MKLTIFSTQNNYVLQGSFAVFSDNHNAYEKLLFHLHDTCTEFTLHEMEEVIHDLIPVAEFIFHYKPVDGLVLEDTILFAKNLD